MQRDLLFQIASCQIRRWQTNIHVMVFYKLSMAHIYKVLYNMSSISPIANKYNYQKIVQRYSSKLYFKSLEIQ